MSGGLNPGFRACVLGEAEPSYVLVILRNGIAIRPLGGIRFRRCPRLPLTGPAHSDQVTMAVMAQQAAVMTRILLLTCFASYASMRMATGYAAGGCVIHEICDDHDGAVAPIALAVWH